MAAVYLQERGADRRHPNRDRPLPEWERNARTGEFGDRMREQIEKKIRKIAELEARNEQLETKIASIER